MMELCWICAAKSSVPPQTLTPCSPIYLHASKIEQTNWADMSRLVARSCILLFPWQALLPPRLNVPFGKPFARLDQLHNIQYLLCSHYRGGNGCKHPRPERVHLVRSGQLHGPCATGRCEQCGWGMRRTAGLSGKAGRFVGG